MPGTPAAATAADPVLNPSADPILSDPEEAYRAEVRDALVDAMLDQSAALRFAPNELLRIAARSSADRSQLSPVDDNSRTIMISLHGSDVTAHLAGQVSRDEVRKRMMIRVF